MKSLNKVQIIGNLTRDPELRTTPNGQPVATIGVATNRSWNDATGEKREEVEYHDVVVWGKLAEICQQILAKGRKVYFEGRLQTRSWDAPDGSKRQKTEIVAQDMIVLDSRGAGGAGSFAPSEGVQTHPEEAQAPAAAAEKAAATPQEAEIDIEDIPF